MFGWGVAAVLVVAVLAFLTGISIKRDGAGDPGERAATAYQARISDKTVYPLAASSSSPWQPAAAMAGSTAGTTAPSAAPLFRRSLPREAAGKQPKAGPGPD